MSEQRITRSYHNGKYGKLKYVVTYSPAIKIGKIAGGVSLESRTNRAGSSYRIRTAKGTILEFGIRKDGRRIAIDPWSRMVRAGLRAIKAAPWYGARIKDLGIASTEIVEGIAGNKPESSEYERPIVAASTRFPHEELRG